MQSQSKRSPTNDYESSLFAREPSMTIEELLSRYAAGEREFVGIELIEANLNGVNLSGANLSRANLSVSNLSGANLSGTNLTEAKLNVAKLRSVNLSKAILNSANLNVANLIRADLGGAELIKAALIRAELIRAELSKSNLYEANLSGSDLREATLRQANLHRATLSDANLQGACLTAANLQQANLNGADLSRADLVGANLRDAEMRQTNLSRANLSGADLSGANLRWADLSGANLAWADLSDAKLSGANLVSADLSDANLVRTSLVHADMTQARLIKADWIGSDLTGAILTGAKLYAVSRFGLKTEGVTCDWIDLSPKGDRTQVFRLTAESSKKFFNETLPTVRIIVDAPLDLDAHLVLATTYSQLTQQYSTINHPPSIEVGSRKTVLTFRIDSNEQLFTTAYTAIVPFADAIATHRSLISLVQTLQSQNFYHLDIQEQKRIQQLAASLGEVIKQVNHFNSLKTISKTIDKVNFFQAPTQTVLTNSTAQTLNVYHHPTFGKHFLSQFNLKNRSNNFLIQAPDFTLPTWEVIINFIKQFDYLEKLKIK